MKAKLKALFDALSTIAGKPIQGLVFLSKNKDRFLVKHSNYTNAQLTSLRSLAKECNPDWTVSVTEGTYKYEPITLIGPPGGQTEDDLINNIQGLS